MAKAPFYEGIKGSALIELRDGERVVVLCRSLRRRASFVVAASGLEPVTKGL